MWIDNKNDYTKLDFHTLLYCDVHVNTTHAYVYITKKNKKKCDKQTE